MNGHVLGRLFLTLLALRLLVWAVLLPPWSGFDEAFHHAYVLDNREQLILPTLAELTFSQQIADQLRVWSIVPGNHHFSGDEPNYEAQQSPLYYWTGGLLLRLFPGIEPISSLYVLRALNVVLAFLAGLVTWLASRRLLGDAAWLPVAYLALLPGLGIAFARVTNDALAALLISLAVAGTLRFPSREPVGRSSLDGWLPYAPSWSSALAAGLAPWAKLYSAVVIPGMCLAGLRKGSRLGTLALAALPALALLAVSWLVHGHIFPLQENIMVESEPSFAEVPWLRNVWTIAKTHVFVAGVPSLVFPKAVHLFALLLLASAAFFSFRDLWRSDRRLLILLGLPLALFALSLLYHSWRNFSMTRAPGGTGGWYAWAMLLPESLFMTWGLARGSLRPALRTSALAFFALLTMAGDLVLFALPGGGLHLVGLEVFGLRPDPATTWQAFATTRPAVVALAAMPLAALSWIVMVGVLVISHRLATAEIPAPEASSPLR